MLTALQIALLPIDLALLVVGYRRDRRRMPAAAVVLSLAGALPDVLEGGAKGYRASHGIGSG